jgi:hypothetical protein
LQEHRPEYHAGTWFCGHRRRRALPVLSLQAQAPLSKSGLDTLGE